ncbi:hypothetical protein QFZ49_001044 [Streptomyces turgidiscabies]|uniref:Uncharacterized protein n=1 Tax=Streptomyces turgidiscabies TaxID=85558 RepID=A0ABU0RGM9_9ACTN|nr:hypothetical protein [Streptomyces turgidiscabies]
MTGTADPIARVGLRRAAMEHTYMGYVFLPMCP